MPSCELVVLDLLAVDSSVDIGSCHAEPRRIVEHFGITLVVAAKETSKESQIEFPSGFQPKYVAATTPDPVTIASFTLQDLPPHLQPETSTINRRIGWNSLCLHRGDAKSGPATDS